MQVALARVVLVRVDVDEFAPELPDFRLEAPGGQPWFFRLDTELRAVDAISADEWDDNVAGNIAPVLQAFSSGKYTHRRQAPPIGTAL
jgi:hypothetical protein